MNITDVRVRKVAKEGKMKAVVSITIDDEFVVHDIKVIEGEKGLFIAMPSRKATDGEYRDIAHPINSATRDRIQTIILDKFQEVMDAEPEETEFLITQLFPTNTSLKRTEFSTVPLIIHPLATRLFFTCAPGLYFAGGRSSIFVLIVGSCLKK